MQFPFVFALLALLSVAVNAIPTGQLFIRDTCSVGKCLAALGPSGVSCSLAALELGKNGPKDAACLAASLNNVVNKPAVCQGCLGEIGTKAHKAETGVKGWIKKTGAKIKHFFTGK